MVKPELGLKRVCVSCATRFYDLGRAPAVCPKCGTEQPVEQPRVRRSGNVVDLRKPKKAAVAGEAEAEADADSETEAEGDEAEEGVLEDTSDLEDDEDDALGTELEVGSDGDEPER